MQTKTISIAYCNEIAIVKLSRSTTNALNLELVNELAETFQNMKHDANVRGLVLTSSNDKFFSIGFDIPRLYHLPKKGFKLFYQTFNRTCMDLFTFPKPTVAAITGHAIAGGCILALCCDYRFVAQGRKLMGLNEIKLGVPVPYLGDCVLRWLVGVRNAREIMDIGEFYEPEKLGQMGMVDQILPLEQVLPRSTEKVKLLGSFPQEAFAMIKHNRVEMLAAQVLERLEEREQFFIERWYSDETRERLKAAMEKF